MLPFLVSKQKPNLHLGTFERRNKMKYILIVSHCILNNASKVAQDETLLEEEYRERDELISACMNKGVQLLQLPCPEFMIYGSKRWGHVKDQFDNAFFRKECQSMLEPVMLQLEEYAGDSERFRLLGVVTVEGSPSCGGKLTCRADWGGELQVDTVVDLIDSVRMEKEPGVFMDVFRAMIEAGNLNIPFMNMREATLMIDTL